MKKITSYTYAEKIKYALVATAFLTLAVFVVLPLLPQADSSKDTIGFKAGTILADAEGGGEAGGGEAGGGDAEGGGEAGGGEGNDAEAGGEAGGGDPVGPGCGDCGGTSEPDPSPTNDTNNSGGDNQTPPPVIDICPNIPGTQDSVPSGMVMDGGNCVTPTPVVWTPYCTGANDPNGNTWQWWEESNTTPKQYRFVRNGDGSCVPPPLDLCPNIAGAQATIPAGMIKDAAGNCVTPIEPDVCPNIAGNQATIPAGMIKDAAGNCVTPPTNISGTISVTPGACVTATERAVTVAWSTQNAQNIVAQAAGGVYGAGQNLITPTPTPSGSVTLNLTAGGYAFSVSGHDGSAWAMLQNTSLIVNTSACATVVDMCPNIAGDQATVPSGMIKDAAGNCVTPPTTNDLVCDISITPGTVNRGDSATMRWDTTNATSVSITDISSPGLDGSQTITVNENKTYTLTATRGSDTKTCSASVSINTGGGGGGSSGPRCSEFTASDSSIQSGESVKLSWRTVRGTKVVIEPDVFNSEESKEVKDGSIIVKPTKDTTYKLIVSRGSRKDTCTTDVRVDDITTITTRDQATVLSFSDIPYTGFDAGPFLTSVFYTLLALWSAAVAYVLVIKKGTVFGFGLFATARGHDSHGHGSHGGHDAHGHGGLMPHRELAHVKDAHGPDSPIMHATHMPTAHHVVASVAAPVAHTVAHAEAPMNLPTAHATHAPAWATIPESHTEEVSEKDVIAELENDAHMHNVLLSSDALRAIVDRGETVPKSKEILSDVIARAKASYPREDGWIILNRERVNALFVETKAAVAPEVPVARVEGGSTLAEALVTGNTTLAYQKLGAQPLFALADAAEDLDNVLRARRGTGSASDLLIHAAGAVSDEKLKAAVVALTTAIDGTYDDEAAAVRLAIIKALKALS